MALGEQAAALAGGMSLVPNYVDQDLARQLAQARIAGTQAQTRALDVESRANTAALNEDQVYESAVQQYLLKPTPQGAHDLIVRFPKKAEPLKQAWSIRDGQQQKTDLTQMGSVLSLASAGKYDQAAARMRTRIDADRAAGQDTSEDEALLEALESKDPAQQKLAVGLIQYQVAAITGPEHFGSVVKSLKDRGGFTLEAGAVRYDDDGNVIAESPIIKGADGTIYEREGGDPKSGGGGKANGNWESFYSGFLASAEGGYSASDGRSGAPVNFGVNQAANPDVDVRSLTQPQAKEILRQRYWEASGADKLPAGLAEVHGDTAVNMGVETAKRMLAQSGGDPAKYLQLREARYRSLGGKDLPVWLRRNEALRSYIGGGSSPRGLKVLVPGNGRDAPSGFRWNGDRLEAIPGGPEDPTVKGGDGGARRMTPQEVRAEGLDPNKIYYRGKDGVPKLIEGQTGRSAELTESQSKATGYLSTAMAAVSALNQVRGYNPSVIAMGLSDLSNKNPLKNNLSQIDRRVLNAQIAFAGALLRLESGAVVSDEEIARKAQTLFPLPGDGPEVQADKRAQREAGIRALQIAAGPGAERVQNAVQPAAAGPVRVRSVQEAQKLAPGTMFVAPNGKTYRKK